MSFAALDAGLRAATPVAGRGPRLDAIGLRHGTDKASDGHGFLDFYQRFLDEMRDDRIRVLDIGVLGGASARMWEEFFPHADIIAIDLDPGCRAVAGGRVRVEIVDQSDPVALGQLCARLGPFALIVDDGSHVWNHQITSLRALYPHVAPGGYYILEDLHTSYDERYRGTASVSAAIYLRRLAEYLVASNAPWPLRTDDDFINAAAPITEFIAFGQRTAVLRRRAEAVSA